MLEFNRTSWSEQQASSQPSRVYRDILMMLAVAFSTLLIAILFYYEVQNLQPEQSKYEIPRTSSMRVWLDFKKASYHNSYGNLVKGEMIIDRMPGFLINADGLLKKDVVIHINSLINSKIILYKGSKFSVKKEFISTVGKFGGIFFPDYNGVVNMVAYSINKNGNISKSIPVRIDSEVHSPSNKLVLNPPNYRTISATNNKVSFGGTRIMKADNSNAGSANNADRESTTYAFNLSYAPHVPYLVILSLIVVTLFNLCNLSYLINFIVNKKWTIFVTQPATEELTIARKRKTSAYLDTYADFQNLATTKKLPGEEKVDYGTASLVLIVITILSLPLSLMLLAIIPKSTEVSAICSLINQLTIALFVLNTITVAWRLWSVYKPTTLFNKI